MTPASAEGGGGHQTTCVPQWEPPFACRVEGTAVVSCARSQARGGWGSAQMPGSPFWGGGRRGFVSGAVWWLLMSQ